MVHCKLISIQFLANPIKIVYKCLVRLKNINSLSQSHDGDGKTMSSLRLSIVCDGVKYDVMSVKSITQKKNVIHATLQEYRANVKKDITFYVNDFVFCL